MRKSTWVAAAIVLGCLFSPPPELSSFGPRAGAVWSEDCCGRPVVRKEPVVPEGAARRGESGWVIVSGILDERGWVTDPIVLAAEPQGVFDKAALEAFDGWRYAQPKSEPGTRREVRALLRFDVARRPAAMPSDGGGMGGGQPGY
jgi:TonB family protein